ncbi:MAG: alpha/beta hydrolase [Chloroflexi bacterium]|nr:MAG: alpha/beta hydrolase [Chloroflexota bacterium]
MLRSGGVSMWYQGVVVAEPWQHFYQSQRLRLAYWTWGDADAPPLILLHGGRDHARNWDRIAEAFRDDYHVIAPDLRGHGDSEWARGSTYTLSEHVIDLIALIDLVGAPVRVVSHSFGGAITLLAAGIFPEKFDRIVEIEGAGARMEDTPRPTTPEQLRKWVMTMRSYEQQTPRVYPTFGEAVARVSEANRALTPEMADHLARWASHGMDGGYVWKFDPWVRGRTLSELTRQELMSVWRAVTAPVMHMVGSKSHFSRARFESKPLDEYFSDSRTVTVADAGHWLHHDQTASFVDLVRDFLGEPPPRKPHAD